MLILLFLWLQRFTFGSSALKRRPRSIAVGSVYIENDTDDLLRIHVESNLVISAFKATLSVEIKLRLMELDLLKMDSQR